MRLCSAELSKGTLIKIQLNHLIKAEKICFRFYLIFLRFFYFLCCFLPFNEFWNSLIKFWGIWVSAKISCIEFGQNQYSLFNSNSSIILMNCLMFYYWIIKNYFLSNLPKFNSKNERFPKIILFSKRSWTWATALQSIEFLFNVFKNSWKSFNLQI